MWDRDNVINYYDKFFDLAEPLLDNHRLDEEEGDILFWYGFHSGDHAMFFCCLSSSLYEPSGTYFSHKQVFHIACEIFLQRPRDIQEEHQDALDQGS